MTAYPFVSKTLRECRKPQSLKHNHCCDVSLQNEGIGYADLNKLRKYPQDLEFTIGIGINKNINIWYNVNVLYSLNIL